MASFPLRYGRISGPFLGLLGMGDRVSGVAVDDAAVGVRMGWAFQGLAPRSSVLGASPSPAVVASRGVHGWRGSWLVNGAGDGIVEIRFEPPMRARVVGVPVSAHRLRVAVADPGALLAALG